jgi:hypothetical protein
MLIRSQVSSLIKGRYDRNSLFYQLPIELIKHIKYLPTPDQDFLNALEDAAYGRLDALKAKLDVNPRLVLQAGNAISRGGLPPMRRLKIT